MFDSRVRKFRPLALSLILAPALLAGFGPAQAATVPSDPERLVAPLARYPESVRQLVLQAARHPSAVAAAALWLKQNRGLPRSEIAGLAALEGWPPEVALLTAHPELLEMLAAYPDWARSLAGLSTLPPVPPPVVVPVRVIVTSPAPRPGVWSWHPVAPTAVALTAPVGAPLPHGTVVRGARPLAPAVGTANPYTPTVGATNRYAPVVGAPNRHAPVAGAPHRYAPVVGAPAALNPAVGRPASLPSSAPRPAPHARHHGHRGSRPH